MHLCDCSTLFRWILTHCAVERAIVFQWACIRCCRIHGPLEVTSYDIAAAETTRQRTAAR